VSIPNVLVANTQGLNSHPNELAAAPGSTSVADNVSFTRDGMPERRNGFKDHSTNLPDFAPEQLIVGSNGTDKYLHLDNGLWYWDEDDETWLRKAGASGTEIDEPQRACITAGKMYVTSRSKHVVYEFDLATGARRIFAGRYGVTGSTNGTGDAARFNNPYGICSDGTNLYVCDGGNFTIRKIVIATQAVTTFAGSPGLTGVTDATGTSARFGATRGICSDGTDLYVCDGIVSIRKILISSAAVTTLAAIGDPKDICFDGANLYVTADNSFVYQMDRTTGATSTVTSSIGSVLGIATDNTYLYVTTLVDLYRVTTGGASTLIAGAGGTGNADGIGAAASFNNPAGVVHDGANLYVMDSLNDLIRRVYLGTNYVTTFDGSRSGSPAATGLPFTLSHIVGPE
jgi:hypothetical protein